MNRNVTHQAGLLPSAFRGLAVSLAVALAVVAVGAFASLSMPDPGKYTGTFAVAALFIAAFAGGLCTARRRGGATLLCGAMTALFILAPLSVFALIFSVKMNISVFALRALGVLACSVLGANVGVGASVGGKKKKKKPRGRG